MPAGRTAELEAREMLRCAALMAGDYNGLANLLTDDLVHIHLTGQVDTKEGYLSGFRDKYRFRNIERGPLRIRFFGNTAVMTGRLTQIIDVRDTEQVLDVTAMTTQVWNHDGTRWQLNTCHNAPLA
ncbi:nuclear transport factor 2 family protein [Falsihalocynthiibacter sp. S25ZX9]|uniref:nuclear transport factor 2 family protein n=1 Tax=Falsihalocynthiibacter sp. S25ZX9 TaxID=3240870 RepID=UPI0035100714